MAIPNLGRRNASLTRVGRRPPHRSAALAVETSTSGATVDPGFGSARGNQAAPDLTDMNDTATAPEQRVDSYDGVRSDAGGPRSNAGVVMHANFDGEADFSAENCALALRLARDEFPIQIAPVSGQPAQIEGTSAEGNRRGLQNLIQNRLDLAESVLYQSGVPTTWNLDFHGRCRVARAEFGTDRIPDGWANRCNAVDELWLPSEFHRETFVASGVEPSKIRIIPRAIDSEVFQPTQSEFRIASEKSFRFLAITDGMFASGTDMLIQAFIEEFTPDEDVSLIIHATAGQFEREITDVEADVLYLIETRCGHKLEEIPPITLLSGPISERERSSLFASSHAFLQTARVQANGQHCLEALACQVPVVAPDWGPLSDFLDHRNSFPLATAGLTLTNPEENDLFAGHRCAEPSFDHLRQQMREVFANRKEAARRAEQGRHDVLNRFEWRVVLPEWIQNFRRLLE